MKKILFILVFFPSVIISQETNNGIKLNQTIDTTYAYIARDLGLCSNGKKPKKLNSEDIPHAKCHKNTRVFHIKPNYFAIYMDAISWCGSCGCGLYLYKHKLDTTLEEIGGMSCIYVDLAQQVNENYIIITDGFLTRKCEVSYSAKYDVKDDKFNFVELVKYEHKYHGIDSEFKEHKDHCIYNDSNWVAKRDYLTW